MYPENLKYRGRAYRHYVKAKRNGSNITRTQPSSPASIGSDGLFYVTLKTEHSMDDKTVQRKLNQLAKIAEELGAEAERRYGRNGNLFYESEGTFHLMDGDSHGSGRDRQKHVKFQSEPFCRMGCGAW
jgi:hypothetical protein